MHDKTVPHGTSLMAEERIDTYKKLLFQWNKAINLIGRNEQENWQKHLEDSIKLAEQVVYAKEVIDLGSGNGLPAILIAILNNQQVTLVERNKKKAVFLQELKRQLKLPITVINKDLLELNLPKEAAITAKAFKPLNEIFRLIYKKYEQQKMFLLKGANYQDEISQAEKNWRFNYQLIKNQEGAIIIVNQLKDKNAQ